MQPRVRLHCASRNLPPRFSGHIFPTTENFKIKFHMPVVRSYLCKIAKFYAIISNFDKIMPDEAQSANEFLHFARKM